MNSKKYEKYKRDYHSFTGQLAKHAMAAKAQSGIFPLRLPIGYRRVFIEGVEKIEIDPISGPLVKLAFELASRKRTSLSKILKIVQAKGLKGHSGEPISRSALHRMLTNEFYAGRLLWKGASVIGAHRPLVGQRRFRSVQETMANRRKYP